MQTIHINASARSKDINGFAAYILGPSSQSKYDSYEVNMDVCKRENSVIYLEDDYSTTYKDYDDSPESQIFLQLMPDGFLILEPADQPRLPFHVLHGAAGPGDVVPHSLAGDPGFLGDLGERVIGIVVQIEVLSLFLGKERTVKIQQHGVV